MSNSTVEGNAWCRRYRPTTTAAARLVCLPHAGGSAPFFLPVAAALSPAVDVVAVQYPGRQDRRAEPPISDMAVLADRIHAVLRGQPELPLTLFGHSLGALVGFEVARRLEAEGHGPVRLFVSGRRGPATHRDEKVHLLDDADIMAELRRMNGTASSVLGDDEMMRAVLPALRADYKIAETYSCGQEVTVDCPISILTGSDDPKTTVDEAETWARHTTGASELKVFPGGHFFLAEHAGEITAMLARHFQADRIGTTA